MAPGRRVLGDPDRASQALDNLVSNALKHGGGTITLTARDEGELVGLHVVDQGNGFTGDMAASAFQRFTRGERARDPGSGLGLSLVAAIAIAHRGVATVRNLPEGGADSCIALPRWFPAAQRACRARRPGDPGGSGPMSPRTPAQPQPAWSAGALSGSDRSNTAARCRRLPSNRCCRPARPRTSGSPNRSGDR